MNDSCEACGQPLPASRRPCTTCGHPMSLHALTERPPRVHKTCTVNDPKPCGCPKFTAAKP